MNRDCRLTGKRILIISPQPWGELHISKHNYAKLLSLHGNEVFFLQPPSSSQVDEKIQSEGVDIHLLAYRRIYPRWLRFKLGGLFQWIQNQRINKLLTKHGRFDIAWCFEQNLYPNLLLFNASLRIYHPVDPLLGEHLKPLHSADRAITVSEQIAKQMRPIIRETAVIPHMLSNSFAQLAIQRNLTYTAAKSGVIRCGYVGNLTRPIIDWPSVRKCISGNPEIEFHFWGPHESASNLGTGTHPSGDLDFLKNSANVFLHGPVSHEKLVNEILICDLFLLAYKKVEGLSDLSNAHKILEYLSTGKVVVCSRISEYESYDGALLVMESEGINNLHVKFSETITRLGHFNSNTLIADRKSLAAGSIPERIFPLLEDLICGNAY